MREPYSYGGDPAVPKFRDDRPIIIFDGCCALCSGYVPKAGDEGRFLG